MSDLPRLLLCSFDVLPGPSGSSRRLTEYLKALPDRFNVVVLSVKTPDHSHIEKYQGARLLRVPVGSGDLASRIQTFERAVRRQLESEEYDLVHFTDPFGGYALCELKGDYGYRLVYEAQTFPSMEMRFTHPHTEGDRRFLAKIRRQELFCLMSSDRVITGSQATRAYIQSIGVSNELVQVVRAPVNLGAYPTELLGVPDGTPMRLMYLGSQLGYQGLNTLLRALALAVQQVDVRLTLVGARHADWQPHLEGLVTELGLQQRVEFQPPVAHDDVAKVLALADVGLLPLEDMERNRAQGGPLAKASEYFAAARPVLAADLPVTRELLPASASVFFPPGDTRALADRIIELAKDVARRTSLGQQGRAFAEQTLDAGLIRGQLLDIYDELLGQRGPSTSTASLQPATTTVTGTPTNRIPHMAPPGSEPAASPPAPAEPAPAPAAASPAAPLPASPAPAPAAPKEAPPDELPLLLGKVLDEGLDNRLIKTEPDVRPNEPPVVMGLPLRESASARATPPKRSESPAPAATTESLWADFPVVPPPRAPRPPVTALWDDFPVPVPGAPVGATLEPSREEPADPEPIIAGTPLSEEPPMQTPKRAPTSESMEVRAPRLEPTPGKPPALPVAQRAPEAPEKGRAPAAPPAPPPLPSTAARAPSSPGLRVPPRLGPAEPPRLAPVDAPPPLRTRLPALPHRPAAGGASDEELPEVDADELPEVAGSSVDAAAEDEELEEISNELLQEAEHAEAQAQAQAQGGPDLPESAMDPWFAQLAHGYCPPEGARFTRHTPPTNFPGRDADTDPHHPAPPTPRAQSSSRGKAS